MTAGRLESAVVLSLLACAAATGAALADTTPTDEDDYIVLLRSSTTPRTKASTPHPERVRAAQDADDGDDEDETPFLDAIRDCLASLEMRGEGVAGHRLAVVRILRRVVRGAVLKLSPSEADALNASSHRTARARARDVPERDVRCDLARSAILGVERDATVRAQGFRVGGPRRYQAVSAQGGMDGAPNWGLDRIDQRRLPLDGRSPATTMSRNQNKTAGTGTMLYVVDSGVMAAHAAFSSRVDGSHGGGGDSRVIMRGDFLGAEPWEQRERTRAMGGDCYGHGTAVASLAVGHLSGLARGASVGSVRVLDCEGNGRISDVIVGLDAAVNHWLSLGGPFARLGSNTGDDVKPRERPPVVLTLSLGVPAGAASKALEEAVTNLVDRYGFTVVVAAGNSRGSNRRHDACTFSPGRVPQVVTVGATDRSDRTWPDGMTGPCVDLMAPGEEVSGASVDGAHEYTEWTGTSMAAPMVAGAVLVQMGEQLHGKLSHDTHLAGMAEKWNVDDEVRVQEGEHGRRTGNRGGSGGGGEQRDGAFRSRSFSPAAVKQHLLDVATRDVLWDVRGQGDSITTNAMTASLPGSPNLLLYVPSEARDGFEEGSGSKSGAVSTAAAFDIDRMASVLLSSTTRSGEDNERLGRVGMTTSPPSLAGYWCPFWRRLLWSC